MAEYDYYDALAGADPSEIEGLPWGEDPERAAKEKHGEDSDEQDSHRG